MSLVQRCHGQNTPRRVARSSGLLLGRANGEQACTLAVSLPSMRPLGPPRRTTLPMLLCGAICAVFANGSAMVQAQQMDAIAREFTVFNDLQNPVAIGDAVAREFTVYNDLTSPVEIKDAVAREFSVFRGEASPPPAYDDAIAREFTIYNDLTNPVQFMDAVTREFSVQNTYHCSGNLTNDGLATIADIPTFVNVLRGTITDPQLRDAADVNCDGRADGLDVEAFVNRLLGH